MNIRKRFFTILTTIVFIFAPLFVFADDDDDDGDGYSFESSGPDVSDMGNWGEDEWNEFLGGAQEDPDGWDGTSATYGQDIHDWWGDDDDIGGSYDPTTTYITDADGNLVALSHDDVYDAEGNFIYSYDGKYSDDPEVKADVEARVAEFFENMKNEKVEESLTEALSRYMEAAKELEEAKKAGEDAKTIAEIESRVADAKAELDALCEEYGYSWSVSQNGNFGVITNKEGKTVLTVGDPVIFATGEFVIDDADLTVRTQKAAFSVKRHYSSARDRKEHLKYGMFGRGWSSNLETRIITGYAQEAIDSIPNWETYIAELEEHEKNISDYLNEDADCSDIYASMQNLLQSARDEYSQIQSLASQSEERKAKNQFAAYGEAAQYCENAGLDTFFYYQDNGTFLVFKKNADDSYSLAPAFANCGVSLSAHGSGYCISYTETGEKRFYSEFGLPQYFTFKNGGKVEFSYDSAMKLKKITVDGLVSISFAWSGENLLSARDERNGRSCTYGYTGGILSSVKDWEGDTKTFAYNANELLEKQIKADGSFVAFEYAHIGGSFRTVKTTNEEGKSEYFDYDLENRTLVYTDYDGISSIYVYDERGRTVHEEHADGTFSDYEYDALNRLIAKTDVSGKTEFSYDERGNLTQKKYPDGSSEKWTYGHAGVSSFTDRDGIVQNYYYNSSLQMTDIYRAGELLIHSEYNSDGSLYATTDCSGNTTFFNYDTYGNLIKKSVCAKGNLTVSKTENWTYDSQNRIISYTDALGHKSTFSYSPHKMVCKNDNGLEIEETYSSRKLLISRLEKDSRTGEKRIRSYEYDKNKNCVAQYIAGVDSRGNAIAKTKLYDFSYSDGGKNTRMISYDSLSSPQKSVLSEFEYDSKGLVARSRQGFYDSASDSFSSSLSMDYYFGYNSYGRVSSVFTSDGLSRSFQENFDGKILSETENGVERKSFEYSPAGRLLRQKNENTGFYEYRYDSAGFCEGWREEGGTLSSFTKVLYYPDGRKKSATDRNGIVTRYFYDEFSNLIKESSIAGEKIWSYDANGRLTAAKILDTIGKTLKEEYWKYDGRTITHIAGTLYRETIELNAFDEVISVTDALGNKTVYVRDILGRVIEEKNANGNKIATTYNALNQVTKVVLADGSFLSYKYDENGNCIEASDAEGILWRKTYDGFSRVKTYSARPYFVTESYSYDECGNLISSVVNGAHVQRANFSSDGKRSDIIDAKGNKHSFEYDGFSRLLSATNSLGKRSEISYFSDGSIQSQKDFNGGVRKYSYSNDKLTMVIAYSDGSEARYDYDFAGNVLHAKNSESDLYFVYDTAGFLVAQYSADGFEALSFSYNSAGQLTNISSQNREISYEWGKTGELLKIEDSLVGENSSLSASVRFVYDNLGRETLRVYASGESVRSVYDRFGHLILKVGYSEKIAPVFVDGSVYDENGRKIYSLDSNLCVTSYSYDDFGRLSAVSYPYSDELREKMKHDVADAGLFYIEENLRFSNTSLSDANYEKIQHLCSQIGIASYQVQINQTILTEEFSYDANNNIISRKNPYGTILCSYDSENRLVSWGDSGKADYDANGNMIFKKTAFSECTYEYNLDDRLRSAVVHLLVDDGYCKYVNSYDALGRRCKAFVSGSGTQKNAYIGLSMQLFDCVKLDSDDSLASSATSKNRTAEGSASYSGRYVFIDDGESETRSVAAENAESLSSVHPLYDTNGMLLSYLSTGGKAGDCVSILMTDSAGTVKNEVVQGVETKSLSYDAFGEPVSEIAQFGFGGKHFNSSLGMYDFGYRDYEPSFARFSSVDPIHDGTNWYAYCDGNPVGFYDKYGLKAVTAEEQYMQDMGHVPLGGDSNYTYESTDEGTKDRTDYADKQGCLVTAVAEALSALTGVPVDNEYINSHPEFFDENYNLDWSAIYDSFGMEHSVVFTAKSDMGGYAWQNAKAEHIINDNDKVTQFAAFFSAIANNGGLTILQDEQTVRSTLENIEKSDATVFVIAQVAYAANSKGGVSLHFVGISTTVTQINGKSCVQVTATSKLDTAKSLGNNRASLGWVVKDGKVFVPLSLVNRIDTVSKPE